MRQACFAVETSCGERVSRKMEDGRMFVFGFETTLSVESVSESARIRWDTARRFSHIKTRQGEEAMQGCAISLTRRARHVTYPIYGA